MPSSSRRAAAEVDRAQLGERLNVFNDALTVWLELTARLRPGTDFSNDPGDPAGLLAARFRGLEHAFARTGLAFTDIRKALDTFDGDSAALGDLENLAHETLSQLEEVTHELRRRWPALDSASDPASVAAVEWIKRAEGPIARALRAGRDTASSAAPAQPAGRTVH